MMSLVGWIDHRALASSAPSLFQSTAGSRLFTQLLAIIILHKARWIRARIHSGREAVDRVDQMDSSSSWDRKGEFGLAKVAHITSESNENQPLMPKVLVAEVVELTGIKVTLSRSLR